MPFSRSIRSARKSIHTVVKSGPMRWLELVFLSGLLLVAAVGHTAIEGRVTSDKGVPVEHARVELPASGALVYTDRNGAFLFEAATVPATLTVNHPRFITATVEAGTEEPLRIELVPKQEIYEEIAVSASRGEEGFAPVSVAAAKVSPQEAAAPPATVGELLIETPGVAENGQGGIFQTYSLRGVSRRRVLTLISGMPIVGERRAGVSASFIDPTLLGSADVVRGPASSYYGSGALGGVVQLFPRKFDALSATAGFGTQGDEKRLTVGGGDEVWSWGVAYRSVSDAEAADGSRLNSGFDQISSTLRSDWSAGGYDYQLSLLGSLGDDIGKANTDFPQRTTVYPEESHLLVSLRMRSASGWQFSAAVHPNRLETRVEEGDERSMVRNRARDLSLSWQNERSAGGHSSVRYGIGYFGRRGVTAEESAFEISTGDRLGPVQRTLDNGGEDELGLYGAWEWNRGRSVYFLGGRLSWQRQENGGGNSADDTAASAFAGLVIPAGKGFEIVANAGSGLRFPSLSERFFSGTTGRGLVTGNPQLDPERSLNFDVGVRWYGQRLFLSSYLFDNTIDDYIERVEQQPGRLTFVNLTSGSIQGVELEGALQFDSRWSLSFGGHTIEGRSDAEDPLADIPADRFFLGGRFVGKRLSGTLRTEKRFAKNDPGSGEKAIPSVQLLSGTVTVPLSDRFRLSLSGRNLLDEEYFNAADRKVPLAPGRSLSVAVEWTAGG